MDERDVLQHLLEVESKAATLVNDAQAAADSRIAEAAKSARSAHEATYTARSSELEASYLSSIEDAKEEYRRLLDAYAAELEALPVDRKGFVLSAEAFLFGDR